VSTALPLCVTLTEPATPTLTLHTTTSQATSTARSAAPFEKEFLLDEFNPLDFYGVNNEKFNLIKAAYPDVRFVARGNALKAFGEPEKLEALSALLNSILNEIRMHGPLASTRMSELLSSPPGGARPMPKPEGSEILKGVNGLSVRARTPGQREMVTSSESNDIVFAVGPAGTGKTYTAVAIAVRAMKEKQVKKIVLVRPAVEAGESLGFLPGDLKEKIDPYLRPLYDALEDMIMPERLAALLEQNLIEIVPLAYMRGRTLNNAYIILDEAQNATEPQMKMFLTRLGMESKIIVTGDETQIDLPRTMRSGLLHGLSILQNIPGIGFVRLTQQDVVRHRLVRNILQAYEEHDKKNEEVPRGLQQRERRTY
jgi:phosphate starvation-inducible PhoH-like protein